MCVARRRKGTGLSRRTRINLAPAMGRRKAGAGLPDEAGQAAVDGWNQMALSIIWVSWPLLTAPIWVASTLPFLNTIRVGMPRTP